MTTANAKYVCIGSLVAKLFLAESAYWFWTEWQEPTLLLNCSLYDDSSALKESCLKVY